MGVRDCYQVSRQPPVSVVLMARHRADEHTGGVVAPQNGELAQNGEFPPFHLGRIILVHMVIPHKVKQPVHQHEPALLDGRIAEIRSLRGNIELVAQSRFHHAVARLTSSLARDIAAHEQVSHAVLSGGVFMNRMLLQETATLLRAEGLRPLVPQLVPTNDGCISFGQAAVARARLAATRGQEIAR